MKFVKSAVLSILIGLVVLFGGFSLMLYNFFKSTPALADYSYSINTTDLEKSGKNHEEQKFQLKSDVSLFARLTWTKA